MTPTRPPRVERQADGCALLVDAFGQGHTPRALIAAIYVLEDQATWFARSGYPAQATELHREANQRRTWVRWLDAFADGL